jgi:hypothetical protein
MEVVIALFALVLSVILVFAQLRLFSIDASLKAILAELKSSNPAPAAQTAATVTPVVDEAQRARTAEIQTNWPGYK